MIQNSAVQGRAYSNEKLNGLNLGLNIATLVFAKLMFANYIHLILWKVFRKSNNCCYAG